MAKKHILIIEPDELVASIIQKSFIGYDPNLQIELAPDPVMSAEIMSKGSVDVILADSEHLLDNPNLLSLLTEIDSDIRTHHPNRLQFNTGRFSIG